MFNHLRIVAGRRIGGMLVPFARAADDKYGNFWDAQTDFGFDRFQNRPLFYFHALKDEFNGRGGTLLDHTFELRADGLYVEADVAENPSGDLVLNLVADGKAGWSSGTMPNYIRTRADGYISRWWIVEGSVADVRDTAAKNGLTRVAHVRVYYPGVEVGGDEMTMNRSTFVGGRVPVGAHGDGTVVPAQPVQPTNGAAPSGVVELPNNQAILDRLAAVEGLLRNPPTLALPAGQPNLRAEANGAGFIGDVHVYSPYDNVSLMGLTCYDMFRRIRAQKEFKPHVREEAFMRAIVDKMRVTYEREQAEMAQMVIPEGTYHIRAVDEEAYNAWHGKVKYLRANEAMQSTLAGAGDELVPTLLNSVAWLGFRLATKVFGLLSVVRPSSNPWQYPLILTGPTTRRVKEVADQASFVLSASPYPTSKPATSLITFSNLGKVGALSLISNELFQDAGISVADAMAERFARAMADAIDYTLLNGDEQANATNISHFGVDPTGTVYDQILLMDGLRRMAGVDTASTAVATLDKDYFKTAQKKMGARGRIGLDLKNIVAIVDPGVYYTILSLTELLTVQNYGPQATILTGEVAALKGIPIVVSDQIEYVNAAGQYPSAHNGTLGSALLVHRDLTKVAVWRELQIIPWDVPEADGFALRADIRMDVNRLESGAVAYNYNTTLT